MRSPYITLQELPAVLVSTEDAVTFVFQILVAIGVSAPKECS